MKSLAFFLFGFLLFGCGSPTGLRPFPSGPLKFFDQFDNSSKVFNPQQVIVAIETPKTLTREYTYKQTPQGDLKLYVYLPSDWQENDKRPAMVLFFGGGFIEGDPDQLAVIAQHFADRGVVVVCPDYRVWSRYYPEWTSHTYEIGQCFEDGKSAVGWVREHAELLGIDPDAIVGMGTSAGGAIAAIAAMNNEDPSSKPNALVIMSAPLLEKSLSHFANQSDLVVKISPFLYLNETTISTILLVGTADAYVEDARDFLVKAKGFGQNTELYTAQTGSHNFYGEWGWFPGTVYAIDQFLFSHGYLKEEPTPLSKSFAALTKEE